jgi:hypothetical protein
MWKVEEKNTSVKLGDLEGLFIFGLEKITIHQFFKCCAITAILGKVLLRLNQKINTIST